MKNVIPLIGSELYLMLESTINGMLQVGIETGYKIGIADGIKFSTELSTLSEGVTKYNG
ncbi:hypothetical protein D3C73_1584140 [compost metagenome]